MFIQTDYSFDRETLTERRTFEIDTEKLLASNGVNSNTPNEYKLYQVTLHDASHINTIHTELVTEGVSPPNTNIKRKVDCITKIIGSRSSEYKLTLAEANELKSDTRIQSIQLHPSEMGVVANTCSTIEYSDYWDKSNQTANTMKSWGLLRVVNGQQTTNWGGSGYSGTGSNTLPTISGTVELTQTGRNVDYVNVDDFGFEFNHPEFAVNPDGSGGTRTVQYNWLQHNPYVLGTAASNYNYNYRSNDTYYSYHPTHVSGTVAGNTQGFARNANIYHIGFNYPLNNMTSNCFQYVKQFHLKKPINPITGKRNPTIMNNSWGLTVPINNYNYSDITSLYYRGTLYQGPLYGGYTGLQGKYEFFSNGQTQFTYVDYSDLFTAKENWYYMVDTTGSALGLLSSPLSSRINEFLGRASLTEYDTPDVGSNDNGYWTVNLPWTFNLMSSNINTIYVNTNSYIHFEQGQLQSSGFSRYSPAGAKWCWCADNRSTQKIFYGIEGTSPNRTFRLRVEADTSAATGAGGSSGMISEYTFYENIPNQLRIILGDNNAKTRNGDTVFASMNGYYFIETCKFNPVYGIPQRNNAMDASLEDAVKHGVISVGAAGNSNYYIDVPNGPDYNNHVLMEERYPGETFYYNRGQSPTAFDSKALGGNFDLPILSVSAVDSDETERKVSFTNYGAGCFIWAPGSAIMSSSTNLGNTVTDPRDSNYYQRKMNGTSMASPHVTGVLACALETYPNMTPQEAIDYIISISKPDQVTYWFTWHYLGPNRYVYYMKERNTTGTVFPKVNFKPRPANGAVYPRPRVKKN